MTVEITDPVTGRTRSLSVPGRQGVNRAYWDFLWDDPQEELDAYKARLMEIRDQIGGRVRETRDTALLRTHRLDFLAHGRTPNLLPGHPYTNTADARTLLLDHLQAVARELEGASTARALNGLRDQLLAFSPFVGDEAFFGFYGEEMTPEAAEPGHYLVRVSTGGATAQGSVRVREDPIAAGTGLDQRTGAVLF